MKKSVLFILFLIVSVTGSFAVTKKAIKPSELPNAITTDILKRYPSFTILEVYRVNNRNILSFEVELLSNKHERIVAFYSSKSKFIKQVKVIPQKTGTKNKH